MVVLLENPIFLILAYLGFAIHILMTMADLANQNVEITLRQYLLKNRYSLIASVIMIPILLILSTDTVLKEVLPLNYITAVLCGWQTDATFKAIVAIGTSRFKKNE
jgi:hypothetical protein